MRISQLSGDGGTVLIRKGDGGSASIGDGGSAGCFPNGEKVDDVVISTDDV